MTYDWKFYLGLIIACLLTQGFFAMSEMACVSFNKVRLQYYISRANRRAKWLNYLINHPAQLFGTTLIGVSTALIVGSEASRRFYESLGLSPDFAPISQFVIVLLFAEIAPLFAGRRYSEHVVMLFIPILFFLSILLKPIIWALDLMCTLINWLVKSPKHGGLYLTREELQNILEEQEVRPANASQAEFDTIVGSIFTLKNKTAKELMIPLASVQMVPSICTIAEMRVLLSTNYSPYIPVYHKIPQNIVSIAYPRDLLRFAENTPVREHGRAPWFITEKGSILQILKQFRRNNKSIAVVLDEAGLAIGILTLDTIIDEIFGNIDDWASFEEMMPRMHHIVLDRTFPGETRIADINAEYAVHLPEEAETLEELVMARLGHPPEKGESIRIDQFELTVEEPSLLGAKMIAVRTVF